MPLTYEEKRRKIIEAGLNPAEYTYVEEPQVVAEAPLYNPQPEETPLVPSPESPLKTAGRSALRSLLPTGGALATMRAAGMLPIPHPIVKGGVVLGAGLLGGLGSSMLQEKGLEAIEGKEDYQKNLQDFAAGQQANPISSVAGGIFPFLPFTNPMGVVKEIGKLATPARISVNKLLTAGAGGALQGGIEAGSEYLQEGKVDPKRVVASTVLGGLLSDPSKLGRRVLGIDVPETAPHIPEKTPTVAEEKPPVYKDTQDAVTTGDELVDPAIEKLRAEIKGKEVKPSLADNKTPEVKSGEPADRNLMQQGEDYIPDPTEKFYQPEGEGSKLTSEQLEKSRELAKTRGVSLEQQPEIISEQSKQPARGVAIPDERRAIVSDIATSDTPSHEVGHNYLRDLRRSTKASDVEFYNRGVKAAGSEEALAQAMGERAVDIQNRPLRTWLEDAKNYLGSKVGLTEENPQQGLARRLMDDRPYSESTELHNSIKKVEKLYSEVGDLKNELTSTKEQSAGFLKALQPLVENIRAQGRSGSKAAEAIINTERDNDRFNGQFTNAFIDAAKKIKDKAAAARYIWETAVLGKAETVINTADKKILDEVIYPVYRKIHETQRAEGLKIKLDGGALRDAIDNPNRRGPLGIAKGVLDVLINKPENNISRQALVQQFIEHQMKYSPLKPNEAQAREMLNTYLRGMGPSSKASSHFNALRKAESIGIPFEWMEKDPVKLFQRYGNRVSRDLAFFKNIEKNPEQRAIWNLQDQEGNYPSVEGIDPLVGPAAETAFKRMTGEHTTSETTYQAIEHFVRGLILGPVTGVKNTISTFAQILPYVSVKDLPKVAEAFRYIKQGFADSMEKGVNRHSITSLETGDVGGINKFADNLRSLGDIIRKYSGANAIEQWTRAHNMALGELLAESMSGRASKGDIKAKAWLRKFGVESFDQPIDTKEVAARFVERVQGTYGARGLPSFLLEPSSPAYWFMSLSKWSVEKSNVIKQDVVNPALRGEDYGPLMRYVFGGLLTGEVIREVTKELFGGKKAATPDIKEIQEKGDADDWAFKVFELAQLAGLGGIISDSIRMVAAKAKGYNNQGFSIPSVEISTNMAKEIGAASRAIADGQPTLDVLKELVINLTTSTVQVGRVAFNAANPEEVDRLNKFRDKRVYDKLDGKNIPPYEGGADKYSSLSEREFKRAKTLEEAKTIAEEKLKPRMAGIDKEERKKERENLKRNSYQTVPADRREAREYLDYITKTQGSEAAKILQEDKKRQDLVNRRKKSLIPR